MKEKSMKCTEKLVTALCLIAVMCLNIPMASAKKKTAPAPVVLNATGQKLLAQYSSMLKDLQGEIKKALPNIDAKQRAMLIKAFAAESQAGKHSDKNPAFVKAEQATLAAGKPILKTIAPFLSSHKLDPTLIKATVIAEATPRGLAAFAQQGKAQQKLIARLVNDTPLMKQMLIAGGAHNGDYGQAMQIYTAIQKASPRASSGVLHRLALACSLDQVSSQGGKIDQVRRYADFKKAYLHGELDPAFPQMTTWELRMVVDEPYSDAEMSWCRKMIRNFRPDLMKIDYRWRYTEISPDSVKYTHIKWGMVPGSKAKQILASGGVCGPRAWFGRMADRAFGIPVWGEQQPGHAAWTHWTPNGFIICQGAQWDICHWYSQPGVDFYLESQARRFPHDYMKVLRAQWVGDTFGETPFNSNHPDEAGFWEAIGHVQQRVIVADNKPSVAKRIHPDSFWGPVNIPAADKKVMVASDGTITIPAVACTKPTNTTRKIRFMKSDLGGYQIHYARLGAKPETFAYTLNAPAGGKYDLTAQVVTVTINQQLAVTVNHGKSAIDVPVPYTAGMWGKTKPVEIQLAKGHNVLVFSRPGKDVRGVTIKDFTLKPAN